jgi:hypothetical protein
VKPATELEKTARLNVTLARAKVPSAIAVASLVKSASKSAVSAVSAALKQTLS